jgi:hypothetical protein
MSQESASFSRESYLLQHGSIGSMWRASDTVGEYVKRFRWSVEKSSKTLSRAQALLT